MTTEERLAILESQIQDTREDVADIKATLKELATIAAMGKGALWMVLKVGGVIVAVLAITKVVLDFADKFVGKHP